MKLFEITNGYVGFSYARVYCIAETEADAINMARCRFKEESAHRVAPYPAKYHENLIATLLSPDISKGFCTEVYD